MTVLNVPCPPIAESAGTRRKLTTLAKINLAELAGVAIQILGDLRIDGGQFQFAVSYFRASGSTSARPEMRLDVRQNYRESFDSKKSSSKHAALGWGYLAANATGARDTTRDSPC